MNIDFRGKTKQILESMVEEGYANTQSEAARLAIVQFGEEHFNEAELVNRKLDKLNKDIDEGKSKLLTPEEALGKYAKFLK
ncbi:MAG: hypothetical protein NUV57_01335 [archaeon]|nr:hypothetical protein [archaeon]